MPRVDASQFRQLLGRFATGVTVLTTRAPGREGGPIGMTASSIASVSLHPPLLLVSVDRQHEMHAAMETASHFVLNVLAADQETLARRFAATEADRFTGVGYRESKQGIALLDGVVAHIECEKHGVTPGGDHTIFLGLVSGGTVTERRPLLYYRGGYAGLRE